MYPVFKREISNNMYGVSPYFLAVNCCSLLSFWFYPLLVSCFLFFILGLPVIDFFAFFQFWATLTMICCCGSAFGMMWGCILTNEIVAIAINQMFVILFNMGSGMLINTGSSANFFIKGLSWISPIHYACELLMFRFLDGKNELVSSTIKEYLGFTYTPIHCYVYMACFFFVIMILGWIAIYQRSS